MKRLVILDIDQTLIHSVDKPAGADGGGRKRGRFTIRVGRGVAPFYVFERTFLQYFLQRLRMLISHSFRVAVWTAAQPDYAKKVLDQIWPSWEDELMFLYCFSKCTTLPSGHVVKDLRKLPHGYDTLLVDDNPSTYSLNTRNNFSVWKMRPFTYDENVVDRELLDVLDHITDSIVRELPFGVRPKTPRGLTPRPSSPARSSPRLSAKSSASPSASPSSSPSASSRPSARRA